LQRSRTQQLTDSERFIAAERRSAALCVAPAAAGSAPPEREAPGVGISQGGRIFSPLDLRRSRDSEATGFIASGRSPELMPRQQRPNVAARLVSAQEYLLERSKAQKMCDGAGDTFGLGLSSTMSFWVLLRWPRAASISPIERLGLFTTLHSTRDRTRARARDRWGLQILAA
jgi:hypothetical protein